MVIFQGNLSFDHYFGTYPRALNATGEPTFHATPQAATCDQDYGYTHEQQAYDRGGMDTFVQFTGRGPTLQQCLTSEGNPAPAGGSNPNYAVLDYYDGNTVTALWNYAQHFAMSDNSYSDTFGPSTPGALNVMSGNTFGAVCGPTSAVFQVSACTAAPGQTASTPGAPAAQGPGTTYSDADPNFDVCSATRDGKTAAQTIQMGGKNIGDLLSAEGLSWGWFQGGFASPNYTPGDSNSDDLSAVCTSAHKNVLGDSQLDYNPHHQPFQYFVSTANPKHLPPTSIDAIGQQDQANHQYDLKDFFAALDHRSLPAVSYLKAADYQHGHAGYSDSG